MKKERQVPVGAGGCFFEERRKLRLPSQEVNCFVSWINPHFEKRLPLSMKKGERTPLGVFLTRRPRGKERIFEVVLMPEEVARSGMTPPFVFEDDEHNRYRDLDLKGIGPYKYLVTEGRGVVSDIEPSDAGDYSESEIGIAQESDVRRDADIAELFHKNGIRSYRVVAIVRLQELFDGEGRRLSIEEARKIGLIEKDRVPVIAVRAYVTKERICYLEQAKDRAEWALLDAKMLVAQEFGFSERDFTTELARRVSCRNKSPRVESF